MKKDPNTLVVTVDGSPGSGKTTIVMLIERALREAGIEVINTDRDTPGMDLQARRLEGLLGRVIVQISQGEKKR